MSDKQTGQASQRKPSTNKNIKKLRTISMVCSLARSWQQWVTENENKQATEPSGWAPSWMRETTEEPKKQWVPKKSLPTQNQPTEASQHHVVDEAQKTSVPHSPHEETQDAAKTEEVKVSAETPVASPIKTKQVVKTVTSGAQEKSIGIGLLAEKIKKEALPSDEEIDKLLKKRSSPTLRRKCSNMVVSLTKSWKQVENEQKLGKEGGGQVEGHLEPGKEGGGQVEGHLELGKEGGGQVEGHPCGVDREDSGHPEVEETLNMEDTQEFRTISMKEAEEKDSEEDSESEVKIKRSTVSTYTKEAEDANKINALSKKYSTVGNLKSRWQNWASEHTVNQKLNPFSEYFDYDYSMSLRLQKGEDGYGRPKEGTKTAERAKRAEQHIHREIDDMCDVLRTMADPDPDGKTRVTFGELFDRYVRISDKVVGILLRARKHGKVAFEGEMLWQGQDDGVIITLLV